MVVGQEKLCRLIDESTLDTFPRSLMIVGLQGSGKHLMCDYVASHLRLPMEDITESLDLETIEGIYHKVEPSIYTIMINKVSVQKENLILKFLEEPLKNTYIILIAETEIGVLPTVLNRCQIWHMQHYKREFLQQFVTNGDERIIEVGQTPGQIITLCSHPFGEMVALADKIINHIKTAALHNTMKISESIAFKDEKDKFNVEIFVDILLSRISKYWGESGERNPVIVRVYTLTSSLRQALEIRSVDKRAIFEKYLIEIREALRGSLV